MYILGNVCMIGCVAAGNACHTKLLILIIKIKTKDVAFIKKNKKKTTMFKI